MLSPETPVCPARIYVPLMSVQIEAQQLVEAETAQARELERSIAAAEVRASLTLHEVCAARQRTTAQRLCLQPGHAG